MEQRAGNASVASNAPGTPLGAAMKYELRLTRNLLGRLHADLDRPHPHAAERVAFLTCRPAPVSREQMILLGAEIHPVRDDDYEQDTSVGAMLGAGAFRRIMQVAYNTPATVVHAHRHEHRGVPWFSDLDLREARRYVPDFWKVRPGFPHGTFVLSHDSAAGLIWNPGSRTPSRLDRITVVGTSLMALGRHE